MEELLADYQEREWRVWRFPVTVGVWSFVGQSLWHAFGVIGVIGLGKKQLIRRLSREAEMPALWFSRIR